MSQTNTLPGPNDHFISLGAAIDMTVEHRSSRETVLATTYKNQDILPNSETFHRNAFDTLLGITGCEGLRIYYGMDENLKVHAIIVPVNEDNEDILPGVLSGHDAGIVEEGQRCPDLCPPSSALNE